MAYSPGENLYLKALADLQFPGTTAEDVDAAMADQGQLAAEGQMPPGTRPGDVLVAEVGSRNLPEQAYTGRYPDTITPIDPTMRDRLASFLQAGFEGMGMKRYKARQTAETLMGGESSNLPLSLGLADIVPFLGTALQTQEAARMGEDAVTSAKQGNYGTAALQAGGAALGLVPGAAGTVKAAKALPKNLPVGLSTEAVGGIKKALASQKAFKSVNVGDKVDGRTVLDGVPNMSSIGASLDEYTVVEGIKEIPLSAFDSEYVSSIKADKLDKRTRELADAIKESKQITPLIVVADSKGFYVLEGGHRFDALIASKAKSLPAVVVIDESDKPSEAVLKGLK